MRRKFPSRPIVGVGGVVIRGRHVLLVRRGREPLKGDWSIPGGLVELGEELTQAVRRELKEEAGLEVEPLGVITVFDRIERQGSRVRYHWVIVDYLCRWKRGRLCPASDVVDARWVGREELSKYQLTQKASEVIRQAFEISKRREQGIPLHRA